MFIVGLILAFFMKEEKNRIKFENEAAERRKSGMSIDIEPEETTGSAPEKELRKSLISETDTNNDNVML